MIVTAIKAAAVIAFFGMTVGLMQPAADRNSAKKQEKNLNMKQVCSEHHKGARLET